jgi:hypothetical protein
MLFKKVFDIYEVRPGTKRPAVQKDNNVKIAVFETCTSFQLFLVGI